MLKPLHTPAINAIFVLACGCTQDGCHDCSVGRHFKDHGPMTGGLWCFNCKQWVPVADMLVMV